MLLKSFILSILRDVKMVDHIGRSGFFLRVFTFIFLFFQVQFLYAQNEKSGSSAVISVSGGSAIFSADESFNQQIRQGRITVKNSSVSDKKSSGRNYLVIVHKRISKLNHADLASHIKDAEVKRKADLIKKIQKQIASREAMKDQFGNHIKNHPSSGGFSKTQNIVKHYVNERSSHDDQHKIAQEQYRNFVLRALDYLHAQKYYAYNSKSFDYCYSRVFSVRPPPIKV
jgi:hypothetical protein